MCVCVCVYPYNIIILLCYSQFNQLDTVAFHSLGQTRVEE